MDEELQNKLKQQYESLPLEIQRAITDANLPLKLQEVVKNNRLMIDQAGKLEMETYLVILGFQPLNNYVNNLIKNVGLSSTQASAVAHDVNESLFKNIRESLEQINKVLTSTDNELDKGNILAGIENPETIKNNEESVSISSQISNGGNAKTPETIKEKTEENNLPEIAPKIGLPAIFSLNSKPTEPFHQNVSPVKNIVESKLKSTITIPKENIVIEEKTKLPEKTKTSGDPYREPTI